MDGSPGTSFDARTTTDNLTQTTEKIASFSQGNVEAIMVPAHATMAGVPAKVIRIAESDEPSRSMDQTLSDLAYQAFNYTI